MYDLSQIPKECRISAPHAAKRNVGYQTVSLRESCKDDRII
ncbi:hypothetical protein Barb4_00093 [Bacteroidales bacterium Barb4]|nr:hypothetical protein Barb4_00093 [Bacteroidales bacterium Barb4]